MGKRAFSQDFIAYLPRWFGVGAARTLAPGAKNRRGRYLGQWLRRSKYDPAECRARGKR